MVAFIDQHRDTYGVEPICAQVRIAPSTYFLHKAQQADPTVRSARAQRDDELRVEIQRVWDGPAGLRPTQGVAPASARADPRRALHGSAIDAGAGPGGYRARPGLGHPARRTADPAGSRPPDSRGPAVITATRPNQLWVSDFTGSCWRRAWRGSRETGSPYVGYVGVRLCTVRLRHRCLSLDGSSAGSVSAVAPHGLRARALERVQAIYDRGRRRPRR